ncbi:MAG: hypothetical protein BWX80_04250 [Candidatus Hydrogenedentes bacterium ADurb.Bin101]|nr:MAG: hypothetical protein BWX80_04250 [Candidatus Hydrogenedentes bacterium ADurb.Bin101]
MSAPKSRPAASAPCFTKIQNWCASPLGITAISSASFSVETVPEGCAGSVFFSHPAARTRTSTIRLDSKYFMFDSSSPNVMGTVCTGGYLSRPVPMIAQALYTDLSARGNEPAYYTHDGRQDENKYLCFVRDVARKKRRLRRNYLCIVLLGAPASLPAFFPKMIITAGKDAGAPSIFKLIINCQRNGRKRLNPHVRNGANVEEASCRFHRDCSPHVLLDAKRQDAASTFLVPIGFTPTTRFLRCGFGKYRLPDLGRV